MVAAGAVADSVAGVRRRGEAARPNREPFAIAIAIAIALPPPAAHLELEAKAFVGPGDRA